MPQDIDGLIADLADIAGAGNVSADTAAYAWDALGTGRGFMGIEGLEPQPLCVVRPRNTKQVADAVRLAARRGVAVVPFGGGSGLMGGAVAVRPSIVIDMTRMSRVVEISRLDQAVRVEAGAVLRDVDGALAPERLMLGHDPWTVSVATVGGAISTDSLGYRGAKYGSMGDQVLALTAVLPDGKVVETRAGAKTSVGPDLRRLFIGAEGCFGIITEATLRAFPRPESRALRAFVFRTFEAGFEAVLNMQALGLTPAVLDYGENFSGEMYEPAPSRLYLGFEGFREEVTAAEARAVMVCQEAGGQDLGEAQAQEFWEHRHDIGDRFAERRRSGPGPSWGGSFDYVHVALPPSRVLAYRTQCIEILRKNGLRPLELGIWCWPGLFSATFMAEGQVDVCRASLAAAVDELVTRAQDLGGSMEYCHGVGLRLAHLMEREHGRGIDVLREIKRALDPLGTMNPGKLGL